jgi:uncharacterized protein YeeX (DUF496 family)
MPTSILLLWSLILGFLKKFRIAKLVAKQFLCFAKLLGDFRKFRETAEITKEMTFAKREIRENHKNVLLNRKKKKKE